MKKLSILAIFSTLILPLTAIAGGVKVKSVDFSTVGKKAKVIINLENRLPETPELSLKKGIVQVEIPGTYVWRRLKRKLPQLEAILIQLSWRISSIRIQCALERLYPTTLKARKIKLM